MFNFLRRQQWYHLLRCEAHANRAITAQSWDYLVYLRDLTVYKDRLSHHRIKSQSALPLWRHLLTVGNIMKCLHGDISVSGPCVSLLILAPERAGSPSTKNTRKKFLSLFWVGICWKTANEETLHQAWSVPVWGCTSNGPAVNVLITKFHQKFW